MNFLQVFFQMLATFQSFFEIELEDLDRPRRDLDIFQPAIIVPPSVIIPSAIIPTTHASTQMTTSEEDVATTMDLNVNVYSNPLCTSGFIPAPALVKDIMLICLMVTNLLFFISSCRKYLIRRRNRNLMHLNHPIHRPIIEHQGKIRKKILSKITNF